MNKNSCILNIGQAFAMGLLLSAAGCESRLPELSEAQEKLAIANKQLAEAQKTNNVLTEQIAKVPSTQLQAPPGGFPGADIPAVDSVEGKFKVEGRRWTPRADEKIKVGSYVEDTLQGRMNQPQGRGTLGKVTVLDVFQGVDHAWVDMGRNCVEHIRLSELCPIAVLDTDVR